MSSKIAPRSLDEIVADLNQRGMWDAISLIDALLNRRAALEAHYAFRPLDDTTRNGEPWLLCNRRTGERTVARFERDAEHNSSSWWASGIRYSDDWPTHYAVLSPLPEEKKADEP